MPNKGCIRLKELFVLSKVHFKVLDLFKEKFCQLTNYIFGVGEQFRTFFHLGHLLLVFF